MRACIVYEWKNKTRENKTTYMDKVFKCYATFHEFGMNYEEFETGPGNYSTAVIEYKDGQLDNVPVEMIKFIVGYIKL